MKRCSARLASLRSVAVLVLLLAGCGARSGETPAPDERQADAAPPAKPKVAEPATPAEPDDPRGAAEAADLAALCRALDHDYIDGTLSDYYGGVEPSTDWGKKTRKGGNEADLPGRHLETAAQEFVAATGEPMPEPCTEFFIQLEDLE